MQAIELDVSGKLVEVLRQDWREQRRERMRLNHDTLRHDGLHLRSPSVISDRGDNLRRNALSCR
jgi:hypothetical protein